MVRLQYYRHNYGLVCMTGLLGCRWHRYKQSTRHNRKRDVSWFVVLLLTSLFMTVMFYFILVSSSDRYGFDRGFSELVGHYMHWYTLFLAMISTMFSYIVILLLLSLCHIVRGHQLYIHPVHLVLILGIVSVCASAAVSSSVIAPSQWAVVYLSLKVIGPFLWLAAVCLMTALTWIISHHCYKITHRGWLLFWLCVYLSVMLGLYISPIFIHSPCVVEKKYIPGRPKLFGHRGTTGTAPENTVISFQRANQYVSGFETDIKISLDGTLFIFHDFTLLWTTNAKSLFPGLDSYRPSSFNISQIKMLNAGAWYLELDPNYNVGDLSDEDAALYRNQSVPTFAEFLKLSVQYNKEVMFDLDLPDQSHPYYSSMAYRVVDAIQASGISHNKIWWLNTTRPSFTPSDYRFTYGGGPTVEYLQQNNMSSVNMGPEEMRLNYFKTYRQQNVTTAVYLVNSHWLYSLYWCVGADFVTTDVCEHLASLQSPIWHLSPSSYLTLWLSMDILSAVLIITIFIVQRIRLHGTKFRPQQTSLNSHSHSSWSRSRGRQARRSLKEKLILQDLSSDIFDIAHEQESELGIASNGYESTVTATEGRILANDYHGNREHIQPEVGLQ